MNSGRAVCASDPRFSEFLSAVIMVVKGTGGFVGEGLLGSSQGVFGLHTGAW